MVGISARISDFRLSTIFPQGDERTNGASRFPANRARLRTAGRSPGCLADRATSALPTSGTRSGTHSAAYSGRPPAQPGRSDAPASRSSCSSTSSSTASSPARRSGSSREAPVLILRYAGESLAPGGGANAVANVMRAGRASAAVRARRRRRERPRARSPPSPRAASPTDAILVRAGLRDADQDAHPRRLSDRHQAAGRALRSRAGGRPRATREIARPARRRSRGAAGARAAVLSDYGYGSVVPALLPEIRAARRPGGAILVDSRFRLGDFAGLDGATPNEEEAEALARAPPRRRRGSRRRRRPRAARAPRRALSAGHPRQPRHGALRRRTAPPTCRSTAPTRWRTSPARATP